MRRGVLLWEVVQLEPSRNVRLPEETERGEEGKGKERMKGDVEGTEEDRRGKDHLKWLQLRKLQRNAKREKGQKIAAELIRG